MATFARVQEILNAALSDWQRQHGRPPNIAKHDPAFGWDTRDQLLQSVAFGLPLIAQDKINNHDGANSNLVIALKTGVSGFPRMPIRGPFLADTVVQEIVDWINAGAPPDVPLQGGEADA